LEGFRATGLWSAHGQFFTECDFAPREVLRGSENLDREDIKEDYLEECTVQFSLFHRAFFKSIMDKTPTHAVFYSTLY